MAEKHEKTGAVTAGICTSGSKVKLSVLTGRLTGSVGDKFYCASKKAMNQEKVLFTMFDRLLGVRGAGLKDISTLCVITGPGRFTGLRVGLTLAGALKTLAGITVYSSTLFEVLAAQAAASKEFRAWASGRKKPRLAALVHAFKNEYFCQLFEVTGHGCTALEAPRWLQDGELARYLQTLGKDIYVIADAEEKPDIYSLAPRELEKAPVRLSKILPEFIIKTGLALKNRNLSPLYLKPAKYELQQHGKTKAP
jgi:tRNA threonylcarbamoyl adenosine modification protein YeaZ